MYILQILLGVNIQDNRERNVDLHVGDGDGLGTAGERALVGAGGTEALVEGDRTALVGEDAFGDGKAEEWHSNPAVGRAARQGNGPSL